MNKTELFFTQYAKNHTNTTPWTTREKSTPSKKFKKVTDSMLCKLRKPLRFNDYGKAWGGVRFWTFGFQSSGFAGVVAYDFLRNCGGFFCCRRHEGTWAIWHSVGFKTEVPGHLLTWCLRVGTVKTEAVKTQRTHLPAPALGTGGLGLRRCLTASLLDLME